MTTLFYFTTIFFLFNELKWIYSPLEKTADAKSFMELSKLNKGKKWDEFSDKYKSELKSKLFLMVPMFWMFIGLLSFQWDAFLMMIIFNFVIVAPISKLTKYSFLYTILHWVNSIIGFAFGIFVIVNHYHLHISLWDYIKPFFIHTGA